MSKPLTLAEQAKKKGVKLVKVRSAYYAGKTVNAPHSVEPGFPAKATFDEKGVAEVTEQLAEALVEAFPRQISK